VAVLHARWPGEQPVDDVLRARCALIEEVVDPPPDRALSARVRRRVLMRHAQLRGIPTWASQRSAAGYTDRLVSLVRDWQPDIIQFEFHVMGQFLRAIGSSRAPKVLVQHEPGVAAATQKGRHDLGIVFRQLDVLAWRRFELSVTRQVDAVVVFTERDHKALETAVGDTRLVTIPLGIDIPPRPLDPGGGDPNDLLFFGSFGHEPNVDAATRLARGIFPRIRAQRPETTLHIVGAGSRSAIDRLAGDGIVVAGEVPDVAPYLDRAAAVIVPLRLGGGMRVKVLDALACGKAVIGTSLAFEGLDVVDGDQVVEAETDEEFAAAALDLLTNPGWRATIASSARAWASANLGWESRIDAYDRLYTSLLTRAASPSVAGAVV
jgi:polysaccharide biosynthesis protein PslH